MHEPMTRARWRGCWALLGALALGGCYSGLGNNASGGGDGGADGGGDGAGDAGDDGGGGAGPADELPAPSTRVYRLTHTQWENTVVDLFGLSAPTGLSENFRSDPSIGGFLFDNQATTLEVDQTLWQAYRGAAVQLAEQVTNDTAIMTAILPADGGDASARAEQFVTEFGRRAYRRPLTDEEVGDLVALFEVAPPLYEGVDPFVAGVRLTLETILQSPHFLYRVETSTEKLGDVIPLSSFERASRMSYFLWDSMPDDELLDLAEADGLDDAEGVAAQVDRMLDDPRAHAVVDHFHDELFEAIKFPNVDPSPAFYPDAPEDLGTIVNEEFERFVADVIFQREGSLKELLTSTKTFVNADLAKIYGLEGTYGADWVAADLDPSQRRGILTQSAFLAAHATTANPDPIHRGVFVAKRLACMVIAAPPNGVPPLPPAEGRTNRQTVEDHTEQPGSNCVTCHGGMINPFGFPFENYDATGAWRTVDAGMPVDATSEIPLDGARVPVTNAIDLAEALAASPSVHSCYLQHWIEFAHGRQTAEQDNAFTARVGTESLDGDLAVRELLTQIVTSRAFLSRATEELQ